MNRDLEELVRSASKQRTVVILTGARQTGKTSLFHHLFPDHRTVSLDLPSEAEQADKDGASFLARHGTPLIIDEAQHAPGLFRHLKLTVEKSRSTPGQYFLTGSQKFPLMEEVSESLAGRAAVLELEPLSFSEIRAAHPGFKVEEAILRAATPSSTATFPSITPSSIVPT